MTAMPITQSVADLIGNTPLIKLKKASELTGCTILGKAEFLNPGQSIKDRAALGIVTAARASGELRPGGTIVEGTAGNTGIGLALVGAAMGHPVVIVIPRARTGSLRASVRGFPLLPSGEGLDARSHAARAPMWMPHSTLSVPAQRPARASSPERTARVHGQQPMEA